MSEDASNSSEQLKGAVIANKAQLIQNLNVKDVLMNRFSWKGIISEDQQSHILSLDGSGQKNGAAEYFIDVLLKSTDPTTWSVFRDVLENEKDLELVKDILYKGETESLRAHEEEKHMVQLMSGCLVEDMDAIVLSEELRSKELLTTSDYEEVQAKRDRHGNTMANYTILSLIVRRKRFYKKFLKILVGLKYHAVAERFQFHYVHKVKEVKDSDEESKEYDSADDNCRGVIGFQVPSSEKKINNLECNNLDDDGPIASRTRSKTKCNNINKNVESEIKANYRESKTLPEVKHDTESSSVRVHTEVYDYRCPDLNLFNAGNHTACDSITQLKLVSGNPITLTSQPKTGNNVYEISMCPHSGDGYGSVLGPLAQSSERYASPLVSVTLSSENCDSHLVSMTPSREDHNKHKVSMTLPNAAEKRQPLLTTERHRMTLDSPKTPDFAENQNHDRKQNDPKLKITEREKDHLKEGIESPQNSKTSASMSEQKTIKALKQTHHKDSAEGQRLNFIDSDRETSNSRRQHPTCSCGRQFGSVERLKNHQMKGCINALKSPGFRPGEIQDQDGSQIKKKYATKQRKETNFKKEMKISPTFVKCKSIEEKTKAPITVAGQKIMEASAQKHIERRKNKHSDSDDSETKTSHDMEGARPKQFLICSCGLKFKSMEALRMHRDNKCSENRQRPERINSLPMTHSKTKANDVQTTIKELKVCTCLAKFNSEERLLLHQKSECSKLRERQEKVSPLPRSDLVNVERIEIPILFPCSCGGRFDSLESLQKHQNSECKNRSQSSQSRNNSSQARQSSTETASSRNGRLGFQSLQTLKLEEKTDKAKPKDK